MPKTHRLDAGAETVHWGYFDAKLSRSSRSTSGDTVTMSTVSGGREVMPPPPLVVPEALAAVQAHVPPAAGPHVHRAGGDRGRQGRPGAGGAHQGDRAPLRLGLQFLGPAHGRAARRLPRAPSHAHHARPGKDDGAAALGPGAAAAAVLRRDGGGAAGGLGQGLDAAAAQERRQSRQQGAGGGHDALSAHPRRRRAVLGRRRPWRAGRRRGVRDGHRDRARSAPSS